MALNVSDPSVSPPCFYCHYCNYRRGPSPLFLLLYIGIEFCSNVTFNVWWGTSLFTPVNQIQGKGSQGLWNSHRLLKWRAGFWGLHEGQILIDCSKNSQNAFRAKWGREMRRKNKGSLLVKSRSGRRNGQKDRATRKSRPMFLFVWLLDSTSMGFLEKGVGKGISKIISKEKEPSFIECL